MNTIIADLKELYKSKESDFSDDMRLRLHRAMSWLEKAYDSSEDLDFCFISLWVAFNSIYANDLSTMNTKIDVCKFLSRICKLDSENTIYKLVWETFSNNIRILLGNHYLFQPFWNEYNKNGKDTGEWKEEFKIENKKIAKAMGNQNTAELLSIIFSRLYTLRNQILHGGATYGSSVNKKQKKESCEFLMKVLPALMSIMIQFHALSWGAPYYPVIDD